MMFATRKIPTIIYDEYMATKNILHTDKTEVSDVIHLFTDNTESADMITYSHTVKLEANAVCMYDLRTGHYIYEHLPVFYGGRVVNGAIIDNIRVETTGMSAQISYSIGEVEYTPSQINEVILIMLQYNRFKIKVVFTEPPNVDNVITIQYRMYLMGMENCAALTNTVLYTKSNIYRGGMCFPV